LVIVPLVIATLVAVATPNVGVTRVGEFDKTTLPEPVEVVTPVPPFATPRVPVTPVVKGNPVAFVSVNALGVPKFGVVSVGDVLRTTEPLPVDVVTPVPPANTGRVPLVSVVVLLA
jgi:hypothetical protein